jgi:hypothetical protein
MKVLFIFMALCGGMMYLDAHTEVVVTLCPNEVGGYSFIGIKRDFDQAKALLPNLNELTCEDKVMEKQDWYVLKNIKRRTFGLAPVVKKP